MIHSGEDELIIESGDSVSRSARANSNRLASSKSEFQSVNGFFYVISDFAR